MPERADTVVIGAGVGGLAVARGLQAEGASVVVLEARDRVGGRLRSIPAGASGIDLGATWFWPNEPRVLGLVEGLGLQVHPQHTAGDALYQVPGQVQRIAGNPIDEPAWRLVGGMQSLADAMAAGLREGTVLLEHVVGAVGETDDGLRVDGSFGSIRAAHVVVALPPALAVHSIDFDPGLPAAVRQLA